MLLEHLDLQKRHSFFGEENTLHPHRTDSRPKEFSLWVYYTPNEYSGGSLAADFQANVF